jgi:UDP-N-acetylmuramoylalanine--D-glutamate ligase
MCLPEQFERELLKNHDLKSPSDKIALLNKACGWNIKINFGNNYLKNVNSARAIFVPQSWELYPEENEPLFNLRNRLINSIHLYLELAPCVTIGVTGSDGKTTTSHIIEHLLREAGRPVWLSGNYRQATHVLENIRSLDPNGYLVLEISNRHLNFGLLYHPDIAVVTNVTQNHLTEYRDFDMYLHVKERILDEGTVAVLNADNAYTQHMGDHCRKRLMFSRLRKRSMTGAVMDGAFVMMDGKKVCDIGCVKLSGSHNVENILAAVTVAHELGLTSGEIGAGLTTFRSVPERLEFMLELEGRQIFNDLSATSAESTRRGLQSFDSVPLSVVVGGETKGVDYDPLARTIKDQNVKVFGVSSMVTEALKDCGVTVNEYSSAHDAISSAYQNTPVGGVIMISPAGAFFSSKFLPRGIKHVISSLQSTGQTSGS